MKTEHMFSSDPDVPFVELRYTRRSAESYKAHSHQEFSVGAVTEGITLTTVRDRTYALSPGSLVLIEPEMVHSCNPPAGAVRSYVVAYFDVQWCHSLQEALFGKLGRFIPPATTLLQDDALFHSLLELATLLPSDALALEKTEKLTQFAGDLFIRACDLSVVPFDREQHGIVDEVKSYLKQQSELKITLEELSATFRCNPYHLLRTFNKIVGLPPHAFMLNARIERAKQLLRDGVSLAAVAAETGFADQSHFHKTFRRIVAATPRQYQQRASN